jgi:hypothetical protein
LVTFTCSRCGKCCLNFGPYLRIERELEEGRYYCHCSLSGEYFFARLGGPEGEVPEKPSISESLHSCPFLRLENPGTYRCAIYATRPNFCRNYRCSVMDILDVRGKRRGRVGGRRSLMSSDPDLLTLWQKEIQSLSIESDMAWREHVTAILEGNDYQVVLFE